MDYSYSTTDPAAVLAIISASTVPALIVGVILVVALWRVFTKAGRPGWAALIPIYNIYTLVKVAGKEGWWTILFFIPIANVVAAIIVALGVAKNFGKSGAFGFFGLFLFNLIGYLILGFGKAQYVGPKA
jgi:hypothetical protein